MIIEHDKKTKLTAILWDSVAEPAALPHAANLWLDPDRASNSAQWCSEMSHYADDPEWLGVKTFKEFNERLTHGWADGAKKIDEVAIRELSNPTSVRRRRVKADQGDEVDMQAVYRGDMSRAWTKTRRQSRATVRTVCVVIDLCASCNVKSSQLFWRGAAALKLAQSLTDSGYNVAIYGAAGSKDADNMGEKLNVGQFVEIKAEDSPLDMDKLAALTGMGGFFRTSMFVGIAFAADQFGRRANESMGTPRQQYIYEAAKMLPIPQNIIIQKPVLDKESAEAWIEETLAAIENPVLEAA